MKPYAWIPTLYFAEALPYMAVMTLSVIMYTNLGLTNTELALYTSWLYLPWVVKPLWSPIVDQLRAKRWWILAMEVLMGAALAGVALSLPMALWLRLSLAFFWLMAFSSATHDIAADGFYIISLSQEAQALYVGIRSTFYRIGSIFCQGILVMVAGWLESRYSVSVAWSITMLLMAALMVGLAGWHAVALPHSEERSAKSEESDNPFISTLRAFFQKPHVWAALLFMLLFRLPEAQLAKMAQPFMLRATAEGGLELGTATVGFAYGTLGVIGLLAGGIVGGWLVSRHGLRRWLWPMALALTLPNAVYLFLAAYMPSNIWVHASCLAVKSIGLGFGTTAYAVCMLSFSRDESGELQPERFAVCSSVSFLVVLLATFFAGYLQEWLGYYRFFWLVLGCSLFTWVSVFFVRVDASAGRKDVGH